jgi:hypothetical protein
VFLEAVQKPANITMLVHDDGVVVPELDSIYKNRVAHDLHDLDAARRVAGATDRVNLGVLFRDDSKARYEEIRRVPPRTNEERVALINTELDRYAV